MVILFPPKPEKRMTTNTIKQINNSWELLSCSVQYVPLTQFFLLSREYPNRKKGWFWKLYHSLSKSTSLRLLEKPAWINQLIKSESVGSFTAWYENKTRGIFECVAFCKRTEAQGGWDLLLAIFRCRKT